MKNSSPANEEYTRSLFRCPICGEVVGCSDKGVVEENGQEKFRTHVIACRDSNGVKPVKARNRE